jgi:phosphoribosylaminoimidazolecarboxamide formyltransferase/IMP cyclohydrolase
MTQVKPIRSALISVHCKDGLAEIAKILNARNVQIYSTGGTQTFLQQEGIPVQAVETLTNYPSILGGRVKTLHPKVFGGILARRSQPNDLAQLQQYDIPAIDLVIVDLYPFEETLRTSVNVNGGETQIIENIDIGGVALIRAAAKNFADVAVVAARSEYANLAQTLERNDGGTTLADRSRMAAQAFNVTSHYDTAIFNYLNRNVDIPAFKQSYADATPLRYGENPHQDAAFFGDITQTLEQLHGKEISYNNLLDIEAAIRLIADFGGTDRIDSRTDNVAVAAFAILKHNNPCGIAVRSGVREAYAAALECDPVSAFGGILVCNSAIDAATAEDINKLFFEVLIAPAYESAALAVLQQKKNRILLRAKSFALPTYQYRSILNGVVQQCADTFSESKQHMRAVTIAVPTAAQVEDLIFANKVVKHSKSNAIVLAQDKRLLASGVGQTSRVDALQQAIEKAQRFGFSLRGAVLASDAFFPFADCVEIAHQSGIAAIVQPGGSMRDQDSIDFCNAHGIAMVFTGVRHFKH